MRVNPSPDVEQIFGMFVSLVFLGQAFTIMLVYIWSRRNPNVRMNFFGLLNFQAPFLPWVLMGFSLLLGNSIIVDLLGPFYSQLLPGWGEPGMGGMTVALIVFFIYRHRCRSCVLLPGGRVSQPTRRRTVAQDSINHVSLCFLAQLAKCSFKGHNYNFSFKSFLKTSLK